MEDFPSYPHDHDDDHDDLAALDLSYGTDDTGSGLDAFDVYSPTEADTDDAGLAATDWMGGESVDEEDQENVFTVTNPAGAVAVSALLDGSVHRIDLAPPVTNMTEAELADEIVVIAGLARQQARSAQYAFVLESMAEFGEGRAETRDFLTRTMGLPSPDQARAEAAETFATRYKDDHE